MIQSISKPASGLTSQPAKGNLSCDAVASAYSSSFFSRPCSWRIDRPTPSRAAASAGSGSTRATRPRRRRPRLATSAAPSTWPGHPTKPPSTSPPTSRSSSGSTAQQVGKGSDPKRVYRFDVKKHIGVGKNVLAVEAKGSGGPSGLLVRASYLPNGMSVVPLLSDGSWKSAKTAAEGWQKPDFDDGKWQAAKVLGQYGKVGPWKGLVWDAGGDDRFTVPPGFRVEQVIKETNLARQHVLRRQGPAAGLAMRRGRSCSAPASRSASDRRAAQQGPGLLRPGQELPGHVLGEGRSAAGRQRAARHRPVPRHATRTTTTRPTRSSCCTSSRAAWASTARTPSSTGRTAGSTS